VSGCWAPARGLGVSGLIPAGDGWVALGTEGGHTSFAPRDEREIAILRYAWKQYDHVSFERLLSGPGLELMHRALAEAAGLAGRAAVGTGDHPARARAAATRLCMPTRWTPSARCWAPRRPTWR
jgi:glucokinase